MIVREINARSILSRSKVYEYTINPYVGCQHACTYCYARFMKRFSGHKEPWGQFVDVKINAPDLLMREVKIYKSIVIASYLYVDYVWLFLFFSSFLNIKTAINQAHNKTKLSCCNCCNCYYITILLRYFTIWTQVLLHFDGCHRHTIHFL